MGKIRNKLIIYSLILSLCSIGVLGAIIQIYCLDVIEEEAMDKATIEAKSLAVNIDNWVVHRKQDVALVAEGLEMQNNLNSEDISKYLVDKEIETGFTYQLGLEDNRLISSSNNSIIDYTNTLEMDWYKDTIGIIGKKISKPYVDERTGNVTITVSQSLNINEIKGVLAVDVSISPLLIGLNLVKGNDAVLASTEAGQLIDTSATSESTTDSISGATDNSNDSSVELTDATSTATVNSTDKSQEIENSGYTFMIDNEGNMLSHKIATYRPITGRFQSIENMIGKDLEEFKNTERTLEERTIIDYDGIEKVLLIEPASEIDWSVAVVIPIDLVMNTRNNVQQIGLIAIIALLLFSVILSVIISNSIAKPIVNIVALSEHISNLEFRDKISEIEKGKKGEIGSLYRALDIIISKLRHFMKDVLDSVNINKDVNNSVVEKFNKLLENTKETSASTEELSANMEETSLSIVSISETTKEIDNAINELTKKIEQGAQKTNEISNKAVEMDERFVQAKNDTMSILDITKEEISQAIEAVKEVEKIDILIKTILDIASQTNLLSLNASIEAARAGEFGRGFTIVANEIRELANNSNASAIEIKSVTKSIKVTVDNLVQNTNKLMVFLQNDIVEDYETMLNTVDNYKEDGITLNDLLTELTAVSEELGVSTEAVTSSIKEISISIDETTSATNDIAGKNTNIVEIVNEAGKVLNKNIEIVDKLSEMLNRVKF